ncbi:DUF3959 domain-containing protein [Bacillus pseudomycoides]|uniref:DUF3959 family protein n=1 Tax=Bacillus TaxID=1386 RepID=UPI00037FAA00|nr:MULTISPECIES: DUF3959 family protein [Bacillus]AIK36901.1 hypothetical protein DJ92_5197 [Bacillus pseudomycoides]AJI15142.1 hypothetical protein BG07_5111 [Bacillus pseudomycoides]MCR8858821.1 DUF3959 family protein [Bacillus pseudomycoides]MCX2824904.1 DUF3959 family protein [Bacillus sp. DHT2]MDR4915361.1 DUF3959 family protein [Bacillus pseudomycoides]
MKKLDVLLMVLSFLFPIAGIMKKIPLELSFYLGGLLFFTSFGSYYAKRMYSRICSWLAYTIFITFLLAIWNQYVTTSSLLANAKIAACIAVIPLLFRFRTYAITLGLLALWGGLLWDIKQAKSLVVLGRIMNLLTSERLYLLLLVVGFLLGGLFANMLKRGSINEKQEKTNLFKQKKKRIKPNFKIRIPSLPRLKVKMPKFSRKSSNSKETRTYEPNREEKTATYHTTQTEQQHHEVETMQGQTRMERRRNRYNA